MSGHANVAPVIIIKRKKVIAGGGHHGGAWKVAYADFVTAMMAFFLLMWLLNATTEQQRKGVADYFSPTIAINRVSGGGDGSFGGDNVFTEETLPQNGMGATNLRPTESNAARGQSGVSPQGGESSDANTTAAEDAAFQMIEEALFGRGGESIVSQETMKHIVTRVTDEGLIIELFDLPGATLFEGQSDQPTELLIELAQMIARVSVLIENQIAVSGYIRSNPVVLADNPVWSMSASRADVMRRTLEIKGMERNRIKRMTGHADQKPAVSDPMALRNNRVEVTLLRDNK